MDLTATIQIAKGMTNMNHYRNLTTYVDCLILSKENFNLKVTSLDDNELGEFAALLLEANDRDTTDCFIESDKYAIDDDITCALLKLLQNDSRDNHIDFATLIRNNTIKRFSKTMQTLINERCEWIESYRKEIAA